MAIGVSMARPGDSAPSCRRRPGLTRAVIAVVLGAFLLLPEIVQAPGAQAQDRPQVTWISPSLIPFAGGILVSLHGTGLDGVASVTFNGVAGGIVAVSSREINVFAPAGRAAGPIDVVLIDAAGQEFAVSENIAYDKPAPAITSLDPDSGPFGGGTTVTVTGLNLQQVLSVEFGGRNAQIIARTPTAITIVTPAMRRPGPVAVWLIGVSGRASATYTLLDPPEIAYADPAEVPLSGGSVMVRGYKFTGLSAVEIDGKAVSYRVEANEVGQPSIVVQVPRRASAGPATLTLVTPNGTTQSRDVLTYVDPPIISSVSPSTIHRKGGTSIRLEGSGLFGVRLSTDLGPITAVMRDPQGTWITFPAPSSPVSGPVALTVANTFGRDATTLTYVGDPIITEISPSSGSSRGGELVTLRGTDLDLVTAVRFGSQSAEILSASARVMIVRTPASSVHGIAIGKVPISLSTAMSTGLTTSEAYLYLDPPSITSVQPASGQAIGGEQVRVLGSNLDGVEAVMFGSRPARILKQSDGELLVLVPRVPAVMGTSAVRLGPVDVTVRGPDGQDGLLSGFTYLDSRPVVRTVSPSMGSRRGGTQVTLSGSFLDTVSSVRFGSLDARIVSASSESVVVTVPASDDFGRVLITVANDVGLSSSTPTYTYEIQPPSFSVVRPNSAPWVGGIRVRILGVNLDDVTNVQVGSASATIVSRLPTELEVVAPPAVEAGAKLGSRAAVAVQVTNPDSTIRLWNAFTYLPPAPVMSGLSPATGSLRGGTKVTITGANFVPGTTVMFGNLQAGIVSLAQDRVVVQTPAGSSPGLVDVEVVSDGGRASRADSYEYLPPPVVTGVFPAFGTTEGGNLVVIQGANLDSTLTVTFDGLAAEVVSRSGDVLAVTAPAALEAGKAGVVEVQVVNPSGMARGRYEYVVPPPVIDSVRPDSGPVSGGTQVLIEGSGLTARMRVLFGGAPATVVSQTATRLVVETPVASAPGPVDVEVVSGDKRASRADIYEYLPPAPVIDAVGPRDGPLAGGTEVRITGRHLDSVNQVTFDGLSSTIQSQSSTRIDVLVPRGRRPGKVDVVVTSPRGSDRAAEAYTYKEAEPQNDDRITITGFAPTSGPMAGGTSITITGSRLDLITGANMGAKPARIVAQSASSIIILSPSADAEYSVNIVLEHGKGGVEAGRFQYTG